MRRITRTVAVTAAALLGLAGLTAVAEPASAATVPGPPTGVTAVVGHSGKAEVTWHRPASDGGSEIQYWVFRPFPGGLEATTSSYYDYGDHLTAQLYVDYGVTYRWSVAAVNDVGQGPFSELAPAVTPVPMVMITSTNTNEGASGTHPMTFTVRLDFGSTRPVTMSYATGKSGAGSDYVATAGTLTFAPSEITKTLTVPVIGDTVYETNEKVPVRLSDVTGGVFRKWTASGLIFNDDALPTVRVIDASKLEGGPGRTSNVRVTVSQSVPTGAVTKVHWSTSDGTAKAGADYTAASGIATIGVGKVSTTFAIPVLGDGTDETDETINVTLDTPANAAVGDGHAVVTIRDDD